MEGASIISLAPEHAVFSVLADVLNSWDEPGVRLQAVKVSVNPSRFGYDEACSVRLRSEQGEGEIGKLLVVPLNQGSFELKVPEKHSGGAAWPELDPDGRRFDEVVARVLSALQQRGLLPETPKEKGGLGFKTPGPGRAS